MGTETKIEWTDATWNPVTGCTNVSEGCRNCYAERVLPRTGQSFDTVVCHPDRLDAPLHWRKPRRIFVNSLSDLFHEDVPREFIKSVVGVTVDCPQHTFQILTKRPQRMLEFCRECAFPSNVWLGVSCEDQQTADERIPLLLQTPAAVRFISAEPLLGPIDARRYLPVIARPREAISEVAASRTPRNDRLDWVICGGESGPHARPMHPTWARSIRDQCQAAGVPFFFKQ
jgi:protein gp37